MSDLRLVAIDADDTLWRNERYFHLTQTRFADLWAVHTDRETLMTRLLDAERRKIGRYDFGIKGFTLSMIEPDGWGVFVPHGVESRLEKPPRPSMHPAIDRFITWVICWR